MVPTVASHRGGRESSLRIGVCRSNSRGNIAANVNSTGLLVIFEPWIRSGDRLLVNFPDRGDGWRTSTRVRMRRNVRVRPSTAACVCISARTRVSMHAYISMRLATSSYAYLGVRMQLHCSQPDDDTHRQPPYEL